MAPAKQRRSRGSNSKAPPATSDDGTLADAPLADAPLTDTPLTETPVGVEDQDQSHHSHQRRQESDVVPETDEIGPLGAQVKEALSIASNLAQLGLSTQEISIPRCVVLGQQSTGKSSLIEALSGIKTPRDTGTCTRVPLFIDMRSSDDRNATWQAEVYLLRQYDVHSPGQAVTDFPGWTPASSPTKIPFAQTSDPARLEELIACAQRATLSPMVNHERFLEPAFQNVNMHSTLFSPNPVGISIRQPGLPALSFFDLPGLIGQAEVEEESFTVPLVQNLVSMYVKESEALVLVTTALENDIAASTASQFARSWGASNRSIGVLTKPDRLTLGTHAADLAKVLDGKSFKLGHGYFVVRNLDQKQIQQGLTHSDARQLEHEFFNTTVPWSTDLQHHQHRFGTINLQHYLSRQLGRQVIAKLPAIHTQIQNRLETVEAELRDIPVVPLHTAQKTVSDVLQAFATEVRNEMNGEHGHESWEITWGKLQQMFFAALEQSKPTMMAIGKQDEGIFASSLTGGSSAAAIVIDSDGSSDVSHAPETPTKKRKHNFQSKRETQTPAPSTPQSKMPKKTLKRSSQVSRITPSSSGTGTVTGLRRVFELDEVAANISQSAQGRVSGGLHPKAREKMMLSVFTHWPIAVNNFFSQLEQELKQRMQQLFDHHFCNWQGSGFYTESLAILMSTLENNFNEQRTVMAAEALNAERLRPYTILDDIFKHEKATIMETLRDARFKIRRIQYFKEAANHYGRELSGPEKEKIKKDITKIALFQAEPYEQELSLVADITAYYMIAARRLVEGIIMRVDDKFFQVLRNTLYEHVQDELNVYDEQRGPHIAQRLLAESPARMERRRVLEGMKDQLLQGLKCFEEHYRNYQVDPVQEPSETAASNDRTPLMSSPTVIDMDDVNQHSLPVRSMSRS